METAAESSDLLRALEEKETSREEMKKEINVWKTGSSRVLSGILESFSNFSSTADGKDRKQRENEEQNVTVLHSIQFPQMQFFFEGKLIKVSPQRKLNSLDLV